MLTRKAFARQEESKLHLALSELKAAKELCSVLSKERDDSERELLGLLDANKNLKLEMAELHKELSEAVQARVSLQTIVDGFEECSIEYVSSLTRISTLEHQLQEAHNQITELENTKYNVTASLNQSLFDELVTSDPNFVSVAPEISSVSHDIVHQSVPSCNEETIRRSRNKTLKKFKKFVRINKYIKKTQKLIKKHNFFIKNVKFSKDRLHLLEKLNLYVNKLEIKTKQYNNEVNNFQIRIGSLQDELESMTTRYSNSEKLNKEYLLAMDKLIIDKSDQCDKQLISNVYNCVSSKCSSHLCVPETKQSHVNLHSTLSSTNSSLLTAIDLVTPLPTPKPLNIKAKNKIVMFSDEIGKNMGVLLSDKGHAVVNYCLPGLSYHNIMQKILDYNYCSSSMLIIFIGNARNVTKRQLLEYNEKLCRLNVDKIVMFTFPYRTCLTQMENESIYNLNLTLHNVKTASNYTTSNMMHVIDINNYVKKKTFLTKDSSNLARYYKKLLADSLSYFFFTSAMNLANKVASFGQCIDIIHLNNDIYTNVNSDINSQTNLN